MKITLECAREHLQETDFALNRTPNGATHMAQEQAKTTRPTHHMESALAICLTQSQFC